MRVSGNSILKNFVFLQLRILNTLKHVNESESLYFDSKSNVMISYEVKDTVLPDLDFTKVDIWLGLIAASYNKKIGNLNYLFCNDDEILKVNKQFLNHYYFTDIITFDYSHKD